VGRKRVEMLEGLEEVVVVIGEGIWEDEDTDGREREGGS
jgi:hypothetical protein